MVSGQRGDFRRVGQSVKGKNMNIKVLVLRSGRLLVYVPGIGFDAFEDWRGLLDYCEREDRIVSVKTSWGRGGRTINLPG